MYRLKRVASMTTSIKYLLAGRGRPISTARQNPVLSLAVGYKPQKSNEQVCLPAHNAKYP